MQETLVKFLGREDLLEKGKATHSRILELPWWLSWQRTHLHCGRPGLGRPLGEEKGYPLEYSGFGEFHGLYSPGDHRDLDTSERLSLLRSHVCTVYLVQADGEQGGPPSLLSGFTAVSTLLNGWNVLFLSYWYLCQSKN